jgi:hypothetical protein
MLADSLYAKHIEAAKSGAVLSASSSGLIRF